MSREAMTLALDALENHTAIKHPQQRYYRDRAIDALRAALETQHDERIEALENTCYALLGKLQVANLKIAFMDLRPELEHHAARILNEEFGEKK